MTKPCWVDYLSDDLPQEANKGADARHLLGDKGAGLKAMCRAGFNVPPGFTIRTIACAAYFRRQRCWPPGLEDELRSNLRRLEAETGRSFGRSHSPLLVAVRSGAEVSMPGMMDTILNCGLHPGLAEAAEESWVFWRLYLQLLRAFADTLEPFRAQCSELSIAPNLNESALGPRFRELALQYLESYRQSTGRAFPTDPWDCLRLSVCAVFDSWNGDRAVAYRSRHGIQGLPGTAVTVQAMFPAEVSGVLFTQDPNQLGQNQMVVEASYGLGQAVVSGEVSPDRYRVNRDRPDDVSVSLGDKTTVVSALGNSSAPGPNAHSLTNDQLIELCQLGRKIEEFFGHPVDVEWGWAQGRFAIFQARRIRGLNVAREAEQARLEEVQRLRGLSARRRQVWVMHNLAETLPMPTPLTWDVVRQFMAGDGGFGTMYRQLGYRPSAQVCREGFLELIGGRIYADPSRLAEMFWDGMPWRYKLEDVLADKTVLDRSPNRFAADQADSRFLLRLPGTLWAMYRTSRILRRERCQVADRFQRTVLPPYLRYIQQKRSEDLDSMSDQQLLTELDDRRRKVLTRFAPESMKPGFIGSVALDALRQLLVQLLGPQKGAALAIDLVQALDNDSTLERVALLHQVARGTAALTDFLERFGHRATHEMELAHPRWREDSTYLQHLITRLRSASDRRPELIRDEAMERFRQTQAMLPKKLTSVGGSAFREQVQQHCQAARSLLPFRELGRHYLMMGYELIRQTIEQLAQRWGLGRNVYYLRWKELESFTQERHRLCETIEARRVRWRAWQQLDMPDVIDSQRLDDLGLPRQLDTTSQLQGVPAAPGVAIGIARIVLKPQQVGILEPDAILVCPSMDPGWTPLFLSVRGLVSDRGGVLSHGAIVARDFGLPAIVCASATRLLREGSRLRVDGTLGTVTVLAEES